MKLCNRRFKRNYHQEDTMTQRRTTLALIFCIAGLTCTAWRKNVASEVSGASKEANIVQTVARANGIYYLELTGTPKEMGRRHGTALKKEIREQIADYRKEVFK